MLFKNKTVTISALFILTLSFSSGAEIHDAVTEGDTTRVRVLLDADPLLLNSRNDDGMTPLCLAAYRVQPGIAALLIGRGADPLIGDVDNSQPLHCCGISGSLAIAKMLLEKGVPVDNRDNNSMTALHFAASNGRLDLAMLLIDHGADVNAQSRQGVTPLMFGAFRVDSVMVDMLISRGADLHARGINGWTYLHYAAWSNRIASLDLLLSRGLNDINVRDNNGTTPLGVAIAPDAYPVAAKLVELGADIKARNANGETALHGAARYGSSETVKLLVEHGADVNASDDYGWTPLHNAAFNNSALVSYLIEKGSDPTGGPDTILKMKPLHIAAEACSLNSVRFLVEHGAPINVLDGQGQTPLHRAVMRGRQDIVEYLLERGAVIDTREKFENRSLLHAAAINGYAGIAKLLIEAGADPNIKDDQGLKPSAYAAYHGFADLDGLLPAESQINSSDFLLDRPLRPGDAAVWYLGHSGWAVLTTNHLLIFDYFFNPSFTVPTGAALASGHIVPAQLKGRAVTVFISHEHYDHFSECCFDWRSELAGINYVLGFRFAPGDSGPVPAHIQLGPDQTRTIDGIEISTIRSADAGVAFLVKVDGLVILHAGDHANADSAMTGQFPKDIDRLAAEGVKIDLAFFGITGCSIGEPVAVRKGVHYAIQKLKPRALFPMHGGNRPDMYQVFMDEVKGKKYATRVMCATDPGDAFVYQGGKVKPFAIHAGAK